jgi:hypothetical protein
VRLTLQLPAEKRHPVDESRVYRGKPVPMVDNGLQPEDIVYDLAYRSKSIIPPTCHA